ncbi:TRAFAC clade GTPase domain-containing protein [Streptomyces ochraceiscleroticus]|uniref:DNA/RNA helicase domain-containing protein n=1 Tax=Streptomyces ochraceiscleroticus TaxID=47761 RepID=A0ABW1MQV9_9ACTN|nr:DNA/RNA helicase domain-containing protein [Streptomyces ochraceiscleroticus]
MLELSDDPFTVRVLVLGPSGSGKTVYLSSLFKRLQVQSSAAVFLECSHAQRIELMDIYRQVRDREEWPASTRVHNGREYTFDCKTRRSTKNHSVLRIKYLDYAGELLTEATEDDAASRAQEELTERLVAADTILCLLDGQYVRELLVGTEAGLDHFHHEMSMIFGLLQSAEKPVHFVITKWDLLAGHAPTEGASLAAVRDALCAVEEFAHLVGNVAMAGNEYAPAVRLLPVSSVGPDYATLEPDGRMRKQRGAAPHPQYVEVPFLAILPDIFASILGQLDDATRRRLIEDIQIGTALTAAERIKWLSGMLSTRLSKALTGALGAVVGGKRLDKVSEAAVEMFASRLTEPGDIKMGLRERELGKVDRLTEEAASARRIAMDRMNAELASFVAKMPASVLRDGEAP